MYNCALCGVNVCMSGDLDKAPKNCPCMHEQKDEIKEMYMHEDNYKIAHISSLISVQGIGKTRLELTMDFAKQCGFNNLGLVFCGGFLKEANMLSRILTYNGFKVNSVLCKNGNIPLSFVDVDIPLELIPKELIEENKPINIPMCNPIAQAKFLNEAKTDLNIILGLCVGHDSLFIKYSEALVTVFAVKDYVLANNPLTAIYQAECEYKDRFFPRK